MSHSCDALIVRVNGKPSFLLSSFLVSVKRGQSLTSEAGSAELWPSCAESSDLFQRLVKIFVFLRNPLHLIRTVAGGRPVIKPGPHLGPLSFHPCLVVNKELNLCRRAYFLFLFFFLASYLFLFLFFFNMEEGYKYFVPVQKLQLIGFIFCFCSRLAVARMLGFFSSLRGTYTSLCGPVTECLRAPQ